MEGRNGTAGFSLIEVLAAITILGLLTAPLCGSLVMAARLNARGDALLQARLLVNSAVETLMAEGIGEDPDPHRFDGLTVDTVPLGEDDPGYPAYKVIVTSDAESEVSVTTWIRPALPDPEGGAGP